MAETTRNGTSIDLGAIVNRLVSVGLPLGLGVAADEETSLMVTLGPGSQGTVPSAEALTCVWGLTQDHLVVIRHMITTWVECGFDGKVTYSPALSEYLDSMDALQSGEASARQAS